MSLIASPPAVEWPNDPWPLRCLSCGGTPEPGDGGYDCPACGVRYPVEDGLLVVQDDPAGDARIARDFHDGPLWPRNRRWLRLFQARQGGARSALMPILRHLPARPGLKLLDVAIGEGAYLEWMPDDWNVVGVDISRVQLAACRARNASRRPRLVLGESENLPFPEDAFDAVLSIGGFNQFPDPEAALRAMVRVVRPGATIVIADLMPNLADRLPGRKVGLPGLDRWVLAKCLGLGAEFAGLVARRRDLDVIGIGCRNLEYFQYEPLWRGAGYLIAGQAPGAGVAAKGPA